MVRPGGGKPMSLEHQGHFISTMYLTLLGGRNGFEWWLLAEKGIIHVIGQ